jgi:hypothetical protein
VKRVFVLFALLGVGAIGLVTPQIISASPPNCKATPGERTITESQGLPSMRVPTAAVAATGCGVVPIVDEPDEVFLCYSKFQVEPGVWPADVARKLLAAGYYLPTAVKGNVPGGTNLGGYHLVCNAPASTTGEVVNENGIVFPGAVAGDTLGYYPLGA